MLKSVYKIYGYLHIPPQKERYNSKKSSKYLLNTKSTIQAWGYAKCNVLKEMLVMCNVTNLALQVKVMQCKTFQNFV